jgi:hypothetical protein
MRTEKESAGHSGGGFPTPLCVGDLVFIRVSALPFRWVARATGSWTNHVGVVIDVAGKEPVVAESRFPLSRTTSLSRFIGRSEGGQFAVTRLKRPLTEAQQQRVRAAATRRLGIFYDTGFNLHSRRQFCSRYVREVVNEATGTLIGEVETFATLLSLQPQSRLGFWRLWYFGRIPWHRETVSPANLLRSPELTTVFDNVAGNGGSACPAAGSV